MSEAQIAKRLVRGSLILFLGNLASTTVSAIAIIVIARLLGPDGYGQYTLAFVIPSILQLFTGLGVNQAVIRYSAYYISIGRPDEAKRFTKNAIVFLSLFGASLSLANFLLASSLSSLVLHREGIAQYVQLSSLFIIGTTITQASASSAIGWNWMGLASLSQVLQSVLRLIIAPILIVVGLGIGGAIIGQVASLLLAGLLTAVVLYQGRLSGRSIEVSHFAKDVKEMVSFGMPVFTGTLIAGLAANYVTLILAAIATNAVVGLYQAALNVTNPIALVSSAIGNALFPAFSSIDGMGGDLQYAFKHSAKYVAFLTTPFILFVVSASRPLIEIFYGQPFLQSVALLQLLAASYLPTALGYTVLPVFFNGVGRTRLTMFTFLAGAVVLAIVAPALSVVLNLGVKGLIYALLISYLTALVVGAALAETRMKVGLGLRSLVLVLLASGVSYVGTLLVPSFLYSNELTFVVIFIVYFAIYLTVAPLIRAVDDTDIDNLELTLRELWMIGRLARPLLRYERLIISVTSRTRVTPVGT